MYGLMNGMAGWRWGPRWAAGLMPLLLAGAANLEAQYYRDNYYPHHNITFAVGGAQPKADLATYFTSRPGIAIGYGYRFQRYFQVDAGFETVFGAGGVRAFQQNAFGYSRIRDYQFFFPVGGRAILPLLGGRLLFAGGGGGAFLKYSELLHQPSDFFHVDCFSCTTRSGWGYYALLDITTFLDRAKHFRLGAVSRVYRGHTSGEPLAAVPGIRTRDHWVNIMAEVGFSF